MHFLSHKNIAWSNALDEQIYTNSAEDNAVQVTFIQHVIFDLDFSFWICHDIDVVVIR